MSRPTGTTGRINLRAPEPAEAKLVQSIWENSFALDDPGGFSRGGFAIAAWSTDTRVLVVDQDVVGVAAMRAEAAPDGAMPGRIALRPDARQPALAHALVDAVVDLVSAAGGPLVRVFVPSEARWAVAAVEAAGFRPARTIAHMLLPAESPAPDVAHIAGIDVRPMRDGEDDMVLEALNRAWTGTWNFVSIPAEMLAEDLRGQREGMLLGIADDGRIVATCHAVFDPEDRNPDGNPRAWISNLTVDPAERGRGIARAMLSAGIAHLRARGAGSITLGVDADNPAPFRLYQSVGFGILSRMLAWDRRGFDTASDAPPALRS